MASRSQHFGKKNLLQSSGLSSPLAIQTKTRTEFMDVPKAKPVLIRNVHASIKEMDFKYGRVGLLMDETFDASELVKELESAYGDVKDLETGASVVEKLTKHWEEKSLFYAKINDRYTSSSKVAELQNLDLGDDVVYKVGVRFSAYDFNPKPNPDFPTTATKRMVGISVILTSFSPIAPNLS